MKTWIGLGSNQGDRRGNLEAAGRELQLLSKEKIRASPIYTTPALIPEGGPEAWRIPFLNAVIEMDWRGSAMDLLVQLKMIEAKLGRIQSERWAPRVIDLDILLFGDQTLAETRGEHHLKVPHSGLLERSFVLDPLKDLLPRFFQKARLVPGHSPLWMAILNFTPDSFSDGGELASDLDFSVRLSKLDDAQILDVGAESTRPGATPLDAKEEWLRLKPALEKIRSHYENRVFRPLVSVDTRHAEVARRALEAGVNWINDVSGLADDAMIDVLKSNSCDYVLMHSLSVPADPKISLPDSVDPVAEVKLWARQQLEKLEQSGIALERIIFDPGIGFGKTAQQSISLLKRIDEFMDLPVRLLVGHSRKGFLKTWTRAEAPDRDPETLGVSLRLAERGVDILRVHAANETMRAFQAYMETRR